MKAGSRLRVAGPDYREAGRVTVFPSSDRLDPAALIITPGLRKIVNEDAGGWDRTEHRAFYAVADAHFGADASFLAIETALTRLVKRLVRREHFEPVRFRTAFAEALGDAEACILREAGTGGSETTLLVLATGWGRSFYGSFGDSRLYQTGSGGGRMVNRPGPAYLSAHARGAAELARDMDCGELCADAPAESARPQQAATRLMLCTDGVPESAGTHERDEWSASAIAEVLEADPGAEGAARGIAAAALRRGGADNICAIVLDVEGSAAGRRGGR